MVSNNQAKLIRSLGQKKHRLANRMFVAEGPKVIRELMEEGLNLEWLFTTDGSDEKNTSSYLITEQELKKISFLKTPNTALAVFRMPKGLQPKEEGLIVALDAVRDPGNLGTIIRLCDWFGVSQLICSEDTADCYNPKVVQASMGSLARVNIIYTNLQQFIQDAHLPVYGGFMDGNNIYAEDLPAEAIIVMGNEANGVSTTISNSITKKISIPRFGKIQKTESLNVATATAILLSEFKRSTGK